MQRGAKAAGTAAGAAAGAAGKSAAEKAGAAGAALAGGVPFVGGLLGWAAGEALEHFVKYLEDVHKYPQHCRDLVELLGGRVPRVLAALDELTDLPQWHEFRNDYDELCDLLMKVQLVLLDAQADAKDAEPAHALVTASIAQRPRWAACLPVRRRAKALADAPRWRHAREVCELSGQLREQCSRQEYTGLMTAHAAARPPAADAARRDFHRQPSVPREPAPAAAAPPAPDHNADVLVQVHEETVPQLTRKLLDVEGLSTVAIIGAGGAGKTALASAVYNAAKGHFDVCHFMTVGRDVDYHAVLRNAWQKLFPDSRQPEFRNAGHALEELVKQLSSGKTLLVLDDLWRHDKAGQPVSMFEALNFATARDTQQNNGSRVLVTTRDSGTLSYKPHVPAPVIVGDRVQMPLLLEAGATELFVRRVYGGGSDVAQLPPARAELVKQFVRKGDGNPKALQLLAGSVRVLDSDEHWRTVLTTYSHASAADDICRTSYDALPPSLRQCVVDLAFFPEDAELLPESLVHMFATHAPLAGPSSVAAARRKLDELLRRSLLEASHTYRLRNFVLRDCFTVHDIVHDLAKSEAVLAAGSSSVGQHKGGRQAQRFTCVQPPQGLTCAQLMVESPSKRAMRAGYSGEQLLSMASTAAQQQSDADPQPPSLQISKLQQLQYLVLHCSSVHDCSPFKLLRYLEIYDETMTSLPESIGDCSQLAHLDLSKCQALTALPERIGECRQLAHLDLEGCEALAALPGRIGDCRQLAHLDLTSCWSLPALPERIGDCRQLAHLDLSSCEALTLLPERICDCRQLAHLDFSGCRTLTALPASIGECRQLAHLALSGLKALTALPASIGECRQLAHLDLNGCQALTALPERIGECRQLAHLDLSCCEALTVLPERIGDCCQLAHLDLSCCEALTVLPERIGDCHQLAHLDLSGCEALTVLPERITDCHQLAHLNLNGCEALTSLPEYIGDNRQLAHLDLSGCEALTALPESIGGCVELRYLCLYACAWLRILPDSLTECIMLEVLDVVDCTQLQRLPRLTGCSCLRKVLMCGCSQLTGLPAPVQHCTHDDDDLVRLDPDDADHGHARGVDLLPQLCGPPPP